MDPNYNKKRSYIEFNRLINYISYKDPSFKQNFLKKYGLDSKTKQGFSMLNNSVSQLANTWRPSTMTEKYITSRKDSTTTTNFPIKFYSKIEEIYKNYNNWVGLKNYFLSNNWSGKQILNIDSDDLPTWYDIFEEDTEVVPS